LRRTLIIVGFGLGLFLIGRATAEPFIIDMTDPATYRDDWGGPSLLGVLAVHCLPGLVAGAVMVGYPMRRHSAKQSRRSV
jgi:hypothetical protein